jgi:hypothetical protein
MLLHKYFVKNALGINAIEVMPIAEFPGDFSWGYNPSHPFAVESIYGGPDAFKSSELRCGIHHLVAVPVGGIRRGTLAGNASGDGSGAGRPQRGADAPHGGFVPATVDRIDIPGPKLFRMVTQGN